MRLSIDGLWGHSSFLSILDEYHDVSILMVGCYHTINEAVYVQSVTRSRVSPRGDRKL